MEDIRPIENKNFIDNFIRSGFWTINLINTYDNCKIKIKCLLKNELSLRHNAFKSINDKNNTINHL